MSGAARLAALLLALPAALFAQNSAVLHAAADPARCLTLLIVSNRFTPSQLATDVTSAAATTPTTSYWDASARIVNPSYERCAQEMVNGLFDHEPFKSYAKAFQVVRVDIPSNGDQPGQGNFRDVPQKTEKVNAFTRRFINDTELDDNLYKITRQYRADNTTVIVNEKAHAGFNFANVNVLPYDTNVVDHRYTATHECGHGLFGLADEYTERGAFIPGALAGCPNVDYFEDASLTKWAKWVGVPNGVPAKGFPGGGGYAPESPARIWHPTKECLMNNHTNAPYCVVCREAAIRKIFHRVSLISSTVPASGKPVTIGPGASTTFAVVTDYAGKEGIVVEWLLDGRNLRRNPGTGGTAAGQGVLSVTVDSAQLGYNGDHVLTALVRDSRAHPLTKSQPAEAEWNIKLEAGIEPALTGQP